MITTTRRQRQILTKLRGIVSAKIRPKGKTQAARAAHLFRERISRWQKACSSFDGVKANYRIFADRFPEKVQLFDVNDLTVYEYRAAKTVKPAFMRAVFRATALKRLNELARLNLVFITTSEHKAALERDPLVRLVQFSEKRDGLRIDIRDAGNE